MRRLWLIARVPTVLLAALSCLLASGITLARTPAPELSVDHEVATAGFYRLQWAPEAESFELQEASSADFEKATTAYRGPDRATVLSGKADGTRYYRVRASVNGQPGPWSDPVTVTVAHHDPGRAFMFLSLGLVVFVVTALTIVRGKETE